jgi:hypothetical protein
MFTGMACGAVGNVLFNPNSSNNIRATMFCGKGGGVIMSLMDRLVDAHFKQDASGRLVFIPFTQRGKCYFVDSKSDEEKVRAFVRMYRIPFTVISLLMTPIVMVPALVLEDFGQLTPRVHRLTVALGISGFFWLSLVALEVMIWVVYRATVPGLTGSLSEVGPEIKAQLQATSAQQVGQRRLILGCVAAGLILMGLALVLLTGRSK